MAAPAFRLSAPSAGKPASRNDVTFRIVYCMGRGSGAPMKVHVFRRADLDLFAYSIDETGANIRPGTGWIRCGAVAGIDKALPKQK